VFDAAFEFQINHVRFREEASNVGYDEKTPREMPELDSQETRILIEPGDLANNTAHPSYKPLGENGSVSVGRDISDDDPSY